MSKRNFCISLKRVKTAANSLQELPENLHILAEGQLWCCSETQCAPEFHKSCPVHRGNSLPPRSSSLNSRCCSHTKQATKHSTSTEFSIPVWHMSHQQGIQKNIGNKNNVNTISANWLGKQQCAYFQLHSISLAQSKTWFFNGRLFGLKTGFRSAQSKSMSR